MIADVSVVKDIAGRARLPFRNLLTNSAAKCWASAALPSVPEEHDLAVGLQAFDNRRDDLLDDPALGSEELVEDRCNLTLCVG